MGRRYSQIIQDNIFLNLVNLRSSASQKRNYSKSWGGLKFFDTRCTLIFTIF